MGKKESVQNGDTGLKRALHEYISNFRRSYATEDEKANSREELATELAVLWDGKEQDRILAITTLLRAVDSVSQIQARKEVNSQ